MKKSFMLLLFVVFLVSGCATEKKEVSLKLPVEPVQKDCIPSSESYIHISTKQAEKKDSVEKKEKVLSNQKLLDSALELCQSANELWNRGEIDMALGTLDQAYSLILKIKTDDPDIIQQRDDLRITIARRIVEIYSSKFTTVTGNGKEIPLVMNKYVKQAITLFQTTERKFFIQSYKRSGRYRPMILRKLKEAGLPKELSWLPLIESGFTVRALSKARALGLWQFIASTGYKFGLNRTRWIDERMDPEKSTDAAIAYLKELHQIFGDWTTALAAYNCGEERVLRCIRSQKINYLDDFWDLYPLLPKETAFYVPKFLAVLHIVNNPKKYGFDLPQPDPPIETDVVVVNKQVHLMTVARYIGVPYKLLKELNPELRLNCTPPNEPYPLKVPREKGEVLLAKLDEIPRWRPKVPYYPYYIRHRVKKGESLWLLAQRYHTSVRAIMRLNNLRNGTLLRAGKILKIPVGRKRIYTAVSASMLVYGKKRLKYTVKKGDSLWKIARRFGVTTKEIIVLNGIRNHSLRIGQIIYIPINEVHVSKKEKMNLSLYKVKKGDTPYEIAKKFGMSLSDFLRINNLRKSSKIFPGQILMVSAK